MIKPKYRALIVDDEMLAIEDLEAVLAGIEGVEVVGRTSTLKEARKVIKDQSPNLIFLDIKLTGESGFDLLESIDKEVKIVFVTAYDKYAIKAFEVDAFDYLLKPVTLERLKSTFEKIETDKEEVIKTELKRNYNEKIFIQLGKSYQFLAFSNIIALQAEDYYSKIYTRNEGTHLVLRSLKSWESILPENHFQRIHRSYIINTNEVDKILPWFNNTHKVIMKNIEEPFVLSRRYFSKIKKILG